MIQFTLGFTIASIIGAWVCFTVVGIISVKTAILIPVGILIGFLAAIGLISFICDK